MAASYPALPVMAASYTAPPNRRGRRHLARAAVQMDAVVKTAGEWLYGADAPSDLATKAVDVQPRRGAAALIDAPNESVATVCQATGATAVLDHDGETITIKLSIQSDPICVRLKTPSRVWTGYRYINMYTEANQFYICLVAADTAYRASGNAHYTIHFVQVGFDGNVVCELCTTLMHTHVPYTVVVCGPNTIAIATESGCISIVRADNELRHDATLCAETRCTWCVRDPVSGNLLVCTPNGSAEYGYTHTGVCVPLPDMCSDPVHVRLLLYDYQIDIDTDGVMQCIDRATRKCVGSRVVNEPIVGAAVQRGVLKLATRGATRTVSLRGSHAVQTSETEAACATFDIWSFMHVGEPTSGKVLAAGDVGGALVCVIKHAKSGDIVTRTI